ncbi:hypothetical protein L596_007981 [Steinernema carpocapsae]|uniref:RING-type domain-containing protein n=1 Tax=Steinernema carpocapsae TaxID=34508 RepID=A0A4U5PC38_STECR|nr:hypothetical protein L596_007981 [Steinernema carpocapsae]
MTHCFLSRCLFFFMPDPTLNNAAATFAMIPGAPGAMSLFGGRGIRNSALSQNIALTSVTPSGYPLVAAGFPFSPLVAPNAFSAASQPIAAYAAAANVMYHQDVGVAPMVYAASASNSHHLQQCYVGAYTGGCPCMLQQPCGLHSALGPSTMAPSTGLLPAAQAATAYRSMAPPMVPAIPMDTPPQVPSNTQYVGHLPSSFRNGRMKRPAPGSNTATTDSAVSSSGRSQMPKVRRVAAVSSREPRDEEVLFDTLPGSTVMPSASIITPTDAAVPSTADRRTCNACGCHRTPSCMTCGCHQLSFPNHMNMCACSSTSQSTAATPIAPNSPMQAPPVPRRDAFEMNAAQTNLMLARRQQLERERVSNNAFYQRQQQQQQQHHHQEVLRRQHQVLFLPHHPQFLTVVSGDALLFPGNAGSLIAAAAAGHMNGERPPVGASVEEIQKCTEKINFVKGEDVPEGEEERCTICLTDFETGEELLKLKCSHMFHTNCAEWFKHDRRCPNCRADLIPSSPSKAAESEDAFENVVPPPEQIAL